MLALLDSGFAPHPDLIYPRCRILAHVTTGRGETKIVRYSSFETPTLSNWPEYPSDELAHGTMTSVIAAGNGARSCGFFRGLASEASVVLVKVTGPASKIKEVEIAKGLRFVLEYADEFGIRVVNLSVGGDDATSSSANRCDLLVEELTDRGIAVVAAAGNRPNAPVLPPASAPSAITVGGIDDRNSREPGRRRFWPSTHGFTSDGIFKPDILAPSAFVPSPIVPDSPHAEHAARVERHYRRLVRSKSDGPESSQLLRGELARSARELKLIDAEHHFADGTSVAAPICSSVLLQMLEVAPHLSPAQLKTILIGTAEPLRDLPEPLTGLRVIAPDRAVQAAHMLALSAPSL